MTAFETETDWQRRDHQHLIDAFRATLDPSSVLCDMLDAMWQRGSLSTAELGAILVKPKGAPAPAEAAPNAQPQAASDVAVRRRISSLNRYLDLFAHSAKARRHRYRLSIVNEAVRSGDGQAPRAYRLKFEADRLALRRFWAPHCGASRVGLFCTTPVFLRDAENRLLVRQLDLNQTDNWTKDAAALLRKFRIRSTKGSRTRNQVSFTELLAAILERFEARRPYVPVGEVRCLFQLAEMFGELGTPAHQGTLNEYMDSREPAPQPVLLGNARTNPLIEKRQRGGQAVFQLRSTSIEVTAGRPRPMRPGGPYVDSLDADGRVFALVSRFVDDRSGITTIISANHSWAYARLAEELRKETSMARILASVGCPKWGELPQRFEILFKLRLGRAEDQIETCDPENWCGFDEMKT